MQKNIHPRDRPGGWRRSCDVEVLGVATFPSSEDFHHERNEKAVGCRIGNALG